MAARPVTRRAHLPIRLQYFSFSRAWVALDGIARVDSIRFDRNRQRGFAARPSLCRSLAASHPHKPHAQRRSAQEPPPPTTTTTTMADQRRLSVFITGATGFVRPFIGSASGAVLAECDLTRPCAYVCGSPNRLASQLLWLSATEATMSQRSFAAPRAKRPRCCASTRS